MFDGIDRTKEDNLVVIFLVLGVSGLMSGVLLFSYNRELFDSLLEFGIWVGKFLLVCLTITTILFILLKILRSIREKKQLRNRLSKSLNEIEAKSDFVQAKKELEFVSKRCTGKLKLRAEKISKKLEAKIHKKEQARIKKHKEEEAQQELEELEKAERIEKLVAYFHSKKSTKTIPDWASYMESDEVQSAITQYYQDVEEEKKDKKLRREIITFLIKHGEFPSHFPKLSLHEKSLYRKYKKKDIRALRKELGYPLGNTFFLSTNLDPEKRAELLAEGFRSVPMNNPATGKAGVNCIIWNNQEKESDYHFCLKHWFAREFEGEVEVLVDNQRVDFVINDVAFEIETGSNKDLQIKKKAQMLEDNFTDWYFISPAKLHARYAKFAPKSQIVTLTQAYQKALEVTGK